MRRNLRFKKENIYYYREISQRINSHPASSPENSVAVSIKASADQFLTSLLILVVYSSVLSAQITITSSEILPGSTQEVFSAPSETTVNIGKTGGSNIYDFTEISFTDTIIQTVYQVSQIPELAARYPADAFVAIESVEEFIAFPLLLSTDSLLFLGSASVYPDSQKYSHFTPPQPFLLYPLTHGLTWSYEGTVAETSYVGGEVVSSRSDTTIETYTVDGFGTLRIPGFEFECLRTNHLISPPGDGNVKQFAFWTREGVTLFVTTAADEPDTGIVEQVFQIVYALPSSLVSVKNSPNLPTEYSLEHNYPNPFNPETTIRYTIPSSARVLLTIYNLRGEEIGRIVDVAQPAGIHTIKWDASGYSSGIYFYRLQTGGFVQTRKMVVLK